MSKREDRKEMARKQAALRAEHDKKGICRSCTEPVKKVKLKNGKIRVYRQCQDHLDADADRKVRMFPLPWIPYRAKGGDLVLVLERG